MKLVPDFVKTMFSTPKAESIAFNELEEAKRQLLEMQTARDYAESMVRYNEARIERLAAYLRASASQS